MSEHTAECDAPAAVPTCEHHYAWVSPRGTSRSARICQFCHEPDPEWLVHVVEVDLGHPRPCIHCEFAETRVIPPACNGECLIASDPAGIPTGGIAVPDPACPAHGTRVNPPGGSDAAE